MQYRDVKLLHSNDNREGRVGTTLSSPLSHGMSLNNFAYILFSRADHMGTHKCKRVREMYFMGKQPRVKKQLLCFRRGSRNLGILGRSLNASLAYQLFLKNSVLLLGILFGTPFAWNTFLRPLHVSFLYLILYCTQTSRIPSGFSGHPTIPYQQLTISGAIA